MATGGMSTPSTDVMRTQFANDDVAFVVERAHAAGLPVTAHAHGLPAVEQALAAGVDAMEHCSCLTDDGVRVTDEVLQTLVERQLLVGAALGAPPPEVYNLAPAAVKAMLQRAGVTFEQVRAMRLQTFGQMHRAVVRFVAGRDSGIQPWLAHGSIWKAAAFNVEAGASTAEAAAAATSRSAEACGIVDHCGRLRPRMPRVHHRCGRRSAGRHHAIGRRPCSGTPGRAGEMMPPCPGCQIGSFCYLR
jgi:imidazolonepropionase-like amidohydrolase